MQARYAPADPIYSVGHSSLSDVVFFGLLKTHRITALVDARSQPSSRFASQFDAALVNSNSEAAGMRYLMMGRELGGRPAKSEFYDPTGRVIYGKLAVSLEFMNGMERLIELSQSLRVAVMCAEEDPHECHRRLLIGFELARRGLEMLHIRADGRVQSEAELRATETAAVQKELFGEDSGWKSIRSVSRPGQRRISSGS